MTLWGWVVLGAVLVVAGLVVGALLALASVVLPRWEPDRDGFSEEDE